MGFPLVSVSPVWHRVHSRAVCFAVSVSPKRLFSSSLALSVSRGATAAAGGWVGGVLGGF